MQPLVPDPARSTFAARLHDREIQIELGHSHHAIVFIHHNHTARSHHRTGRQQIVIIDRQIQMFLGQASARRPSRLYSLEFLSVNIFIIYTAFVICIGLIFVLLFGNICIALFNEYLKNEVLFINYRLFIFQYEPYLLLLGLVVLTGIFILLNPMLSLKKIDIATLVKLNN